MGETDYQLERYRLTTHICFPVTSSCPMGEGLPVNITGFFPPWKFSPEPRLSSTTMVVFYVSYPVRRKNSGYDLSCY